MADHRAEQIVAAVETAVTGLATTGANAFRGRVWPTQDADLPALLVYMGPDRAADAENQNLQSFDSTLTVYVVPTVKTASAQVDTVLNQIRKEVEIALAADRQLGLGFVIDSGFIEAGPPDLSEGDRPVAMQTLTYEILYRRSVLDPSQ